MHTSTESAARRDETIRRRSVHILIVDDDPDFLDLLTGEIGRIPGVEVDVAHGPAEAVRMLTKRDYELVVSDWALEETNASEVLSRADILRLEEEASGKIPVLFISGSEKVSQTQVLRSLKTFEPVSFLLKSLGPNLIRLLAQHLVNRQAREPKPC